MTPPAKLCASCLSRPRRLVCLHCGDALCRRCAGHRACSCYVKVAAPEYEQLAPPPKPSSTPSTPRERAAEAPAASTTPRLAPDAGGGRAVSALPLTTLTSVALDLAKAGPFYAGQLAERTGKAVETCRSLLWQLQKRGLLTYTPPPEGPGRGRSGQYAAAVPVEQLVPAKPAKARRSMEPRAARVGEPAGDEAAELERYGVRRVPVEQAAKDRGPRAQVTGVYRSKADFYADKPALPAARPVVPRYA